MKHLPLPALDPRRPVTRQRDIKTERALKRLRRRNEVFRTMPVEIVRNFARLSVLSAEVWEKLEKHGLVSADGTWSPGIDLFRRLADSETKMLSVMLNIAGQQRDARDSRPVFDVEGFRDAVETESQDETADSEAADESD